MPVAVVGGEETAPLLGKLSVLKSLLPDTMPWLPITPTFPLGLLPLPARWRIRFGEPIDPRDTIKDEGDAVAINALAATIRERLQKDVRDLVQARGSAWL